VAREGGHATDPLGIPAALALVLAVAGCANPDGVDGDLTKGKGTQSLPIQYK
jgi:hypothetical protein